MSRALAVALVVFFTGCALPPPEGSPRIAYREAESTRSLVVPPDLTRQASSSALEIDQLGAGEGAEVLPEFENIRMVRAGPLQWLEIEGASPDELWPRMRGFFSNEGLAIGNQRPAEGLIETVWAERFDSVPQGGLSGMFADFFGTIASDPIRDKYQIRLERIENNGGTRIFLTHWAAQQINENPNTRDTPLLAMARIEPDPAIAAEMRRRLLVYLGVSRSRATRVASLDEGADVYTAPMRLVETEDGEARALLAVPNYRRAFGLVGEGVRLAGAEVVDTRADRGRIWLQWLPPKAVRDSGFFSDDRPKNLVLRLEPIEGGVSIIAGRYSGRIGQADGYDETFSSGKVEVALLEELVNAMGGDISSYRDVEDLDDVGPSKLTDPEYR
ncbi:MAG: outer membrane protein assembly factor BamC [Halofilum sp. (in: g-proteobacteria)]|nr:outer membrane protein assembly factor BamC [Halofilum sp. (in: g-proteobacteria)]